MLIQSTIGLCQFTYNLCYGALERAAVAVAHLQPQEEVLGPGCCSHPLLPPTQLSIPHEVKVTYNWFSVVDYYSPVARCVFKDQCF